MVSSKLNSAAMTELEAWLKKERGRAKRLAAHLGVSKARMSQIAKRVPREHLLSVRDFTGGAVSLEAMLQTPVQLESADA